MNGLSLSAFQDAFAQALWSTATPDAAAARLPPAVARLVAQPGFAVYRNTVMKGCVDALQANYPAVARLVGAEWFRAAAAVYARDALPMRPTLLTYGEGFADFLARFPPAAELPYLAGVARLDRAWSEVHVAADADALGAAALAELAAKGGDAMATITLEPHPAARWIACESMPIHTLWRRNRGDSEDGGDDLEWQGECALLTRPVAQVLDARMPAGGIAFLAACARGDSIVQAVAGTLDAAPETDLAALIHQLLEAGAFCALRRCAERA